MTRERKQLILFALLGPVLLMALIGGNELYGWFLVQRELRLCREAGMDLDPAHHIPPPVPDDQNAAPLVLEACKRLSEVRSRLPYEAEELLGLLSPLGCPREREVLAWAERILREYEPAFQLLDNALERPRCRYQPWGPNNKDSPPLAKVFRFARFAQYRVVYDCLNSGSEAAYRQLRRIMLARKALGEDRLIIIALVDSGYLVSNLMALGDLLECAGPPSPEVARSLLAMIPECDEMAECWRRSVASDMARLFLPYWDQGHPGWFRITRPFEKQHKAFALRMYRWAFDDFGAPLAASDARGWPEDRWYHVSYSFWMRSWLYATPSWYRDTDSASAYGWAKTVANLIARAELARVALRVELHKHEHGAYPDSLQELTLPEGEVLPFDAFDGRPYRYEREEKGYKLWSVGRNCVDDGGVPNDEDPEEGDIVIWVGPAGRAARMAEWEGDREDREEEVDRVLEELEAAWKVYEEEKAEAP